MSVDEREQREQIVEALRAFALVDSELGRVFARSQRMHHTDAAAIVEILTAEQHGQPLSPAGLAKRVGLTSGATSTLLNRLETAGHITRTREHLDRRVVTLHSTAAVHDEAAAFFAPLAQQLDTVLRSYSSSELDTVMNVIVSLRTVLSQAASVWPPP